MSLLEIGGILLVMVVLFSAARGKVRIDAREVSDFEARLRPAADAVAAVRASGKAEREEWDDGSAEFEAYVRGLDLPNGSQVEFLVDGVSLGRAALQNGRARLEYDSRDGDDVPPIGEGQRLVVRHADADLLVGTFRPD